LTFLTKNQLLSDVTSMESSRRPSSNKFLFSLFNCQQIQSKQPTAATMVTGLKGDEMGASVAPVKQNYSRVRVVGANVVRDGLTKNKKTKKHLCSLTSPKNSQHVSGEANCPISRKPNNIIRLGHSNGSRAKVGKPQLVLLKMISSVM